MLATKRTRALYKAKGYPDDGIEKRMRGIAIREQLTNEWEQRAERVEKPQKRKFARSYDRFGANFQHARRGLHN